MTDSENPTSSLSFLDVLCSCMGGTAFLVVLFAAIGKNPSVSGTPLNRRILIVEVGETGSDFLVREDIGLFLADRDGEWSFLNDPQTPTGTWTVAWSQEPSARYSLRIDMEGDQNSDDIERLNLYLGIWLRRIDGKKLNNPDYLSALRDGVPCRVFWAHKPEDVCWEGRLQAMHRFFETIDLVARKAVDLKEAGLTSPASLPVARKQPNEAELLESLRVVKQFGEPGDGTFLNLHVRANSEWGRIESFGKGAFKGLLRWQGGRYPFDDRAYLMRLQGLTLESGAYVAVGERGVCANSSDRLRLSLVPPWTNLLPLISKSAVEKEVELDLSTIAAESPLGLRSATPRDMLDLLAEACAFGPDYSEGRMHQDPLIWALQGGDR